MTNISLLYSQYHHILFHPDRIPLAMAAILLVAVVGMIGGPVLGNANPLVWIITDKLLGKPGIKLDRVNRKPADLIMRGFFLTVIGLILFYFVGRGAQHLNERYAFKGVTEILLLSLCLSAGSVWFALRRLYIAVKDKKVSKNAYYTIAVSVRTDLSGSDDYTITRVGMAFAARAFDKGIVAPVFWYLIGGLPFVYMYAGIAGLAWRFGRDGFTHGFGRVPLELERLMGFIPSFISGVLMALAGVLTPTAGLTRAVIGLLRTEGQAPYFQGGLSLTAMANALKVALGGPTVDLDGRSIQRAWVGPRSATAKLDAGHIRRALYITLMAHLLFLAGIGACLMFIPVTSQ